MTRVAVFVDNMERHLILFDEQINDEWWRWLSNSHQYNSWMDSEILTPYWRVCLNHNYRAVVMMWLKEVLVMQTDFLALYNISKDNRHIRIRSRHRFFWLSFYDCDHLWLTVNMISALKSLGLCRWNSTYWAFKSKYIKSKQRCRALPHMGQDNLPLIYTL